MGEARSSTNLDKPLRDASLSQAVYRFFAKFFVFKGRASRSEYWWVFLAITVGSIPVSMLEIHFGIPVGKVVGVILLIPFLALISRRLQDAGFSGLLTILVFVPVLGSIAIMIMTLMPSEMTSSMDSEGSE
ncbi:DUF805 domain-containing protein [Corynebacterium genitalium ATCC 33030]|uniref:DUF805 domain-containing protein n=1 Tax=Corynebacterium genitalium ATCC 33030 TaxID=585529 RepID=D7WFA4_9CORY|nr:MULTISPECIES: DUF805 domain-containing protein [Corynebacterium]EFK54538.1 hypothetical protein HMPREF0291_12196 [Corynebacterium genitalium ATCC 33030]MCQ4620845.1 DUF805 domain-containing protein [Corynebacterium sp. CCUG 71335]MCQ4623853.1 DUF805 domain-containing protein [Corynebacterium sp. CCUG 70398]MCQ4625967.1 DUF805 domain-containing protein [Corynebacterium sp. CCUG 69979]UUA89976.1 DUF805 domain-containing protein [Corynebacterium genitalium ATCC 33030]